MLMMLMMLMSECVVWFFVAHFSLKSPICFKLSLISFSTLYGTISNYISPSQGLYGRQSKDRK